MAVTNVYKATASPAHTSNFFSLRGIFSCCYGQRKRRDSERRGDGKASGDEGSAQKILPESSDSEDSEDEVRSNFNRLQAGGSFRVLGEAERFQEAFALIAASTHNSRSKNDSAKAKDSVDRGLAEGASLRSFPADPSASRAVSQFDESQSLLGWGSRASKASKSVASYGGDSVGAPRSMVTSVSLSVAEESEGSEHLSDDSSITQYSEEFGDTPQGVSAFAEASDEEGDDKRPTTSVSTLGVLSLGILFEPRKARVVVRVRNVKHVPDKEKGGSTAYQLHLVLLPDKRQRFQTKQRPAGKLSFEQKFTFTKVSPKSIAELALRVRLYGCERMRRERLAAETVVALTTFELTPDEKMFDIPLEPRTKLKSRKFITELQPSKAKPEEADLKGRQKTLSSESDSSASLPTSPIRKSGDSNSGSESGASLEGVVMHGNNLPELLLGLSYNGTTGRLAVEVIRGSTFAAASLTRPPDGYVKLSLLSSNGQTFARSKTSIRRNDPNPTFKETFMFQIAMFQLEDITLMVFVYHKKGIRRKESIGWFSLGLNSSGEEEIAHWQDMRDALGDRIFRWHLLLEPA